MADSTEASGRGGPGKVTGTREIGPLKVHTTDLDGVLLVEPRVFTDDRGFFLETARANLLAEAGVGPELVQDNHSRSGRGTLRGLHFQTPPGQSKLVRCARGAIWDVAVDLRRGSSTFGEWRSFVLSDENHHQLWIPEGFAHGFCVTSEVADVTYRCGSYYDGESERGIAWDSPELGIAWPVEDPQLSERDRSNPSFNDYPGPWYP